MGVTQIDIKLLEGIIKQYNIKSVIELGAQQNYAQPNLPAPYMTKWYFDHGLMTYKCIDISGENSPYNYATDLSKPIKLMAQVWGGLESDYDLVTDFGTADHIGIDGKFNWEAIYSCWLWKWHLSKQNGIIISENPRTGHWPLHGFNYFTKEFYRQLEAHSDLKILLVDDEICAMGNCATGKNVLCIQQKFGNRFPDIETFKTFDLRQS